MNKRQLLVVWALAVWLIFSFLSVSYQSEYWINLDEKTLTGTRIPSHFSFDWRSQKAELLPLVVPALLIAVPLVFTLRNKKKVGN